MSRSYRSTNVSTGLAGAVLCAAVAAIHVQDQGGLTAFADPDWLGWAYRLLELGALATAAALVFLTGASASAANPGPRLVRAAWAVTLLVGLGPLVGFVLSRTTGLPGSSDDIGNWGEPLGIVSLVVEGVLILLAAGMLAATRHPAPHRPLPTPERRHALAS